MALYDDIIEKKNTRPLSAHIVDNKIKSNTSYQKSNDIEGIIETAAQYWEEGGKYENKEPVVGVALESSENGVTQTCAINTAGDDFPHLLYDDTGYSFLTEKDAICKTSAFTVDRGIKIFQKDDWYFPIIGYTDYASRCLNCNNNAGCDICNACYNGVVDCFGCTTGCTSNCTSGCTSGCTTGCTATCVGVVTPGCYEGCTLACTAACVSGCTTACTDCDSEYTHCDTETGEEEEPCEGCDSCTSCDSCDGCVDSNVSEEDHPDPQPSPCDCNSCTNCTSCNGNVVQEHCKNDTVCSSCTAGCTDGCTNGCNGGCTTCNACTTACQNNLNGVGDGCIALVDQRECNQNVDCHGTVTWTGGCKKGVVTCANNNAAIYECDSEVFQPCSSQNVDYEACKLLTSWVACTGNCNTNSFTTETCLAGLTISTDPTCDTCVESCTSCDGSCASSCNSGCTGPCTACNAGCTASCAAGCTSGCTSGCTGSCTSGCTASCTNCAGCTNCTGCASQTGCSGCTGGCTNCDGCTTSCTGCDGCTTGCASGCTSGCTQCTTGCTGGTGHCTGLCFGCAGAAYGGCSGSVGCTGVGN